MIRPSANLSKKNNPVNIQHRNGHNFYTPGILTSEKDELASFFPAHIKMFVVQNIFDSCVIW